VLTLGVLIEFGVARREMDDEIEFFQPSKWREGRSDFGFRIFSRRFERSDVAIAEAGPIGAVELSRLAMKIHEAVLLAKSFRLLVRFVISRQNEEAFAKRLQNSCAAFQSFAEVAKIAGGDVNVRGLRDDALKSAQIAVNITEDKYFHRTFPE